ncbi:MAG: hypothetical protein GX096_10595 [Clostridiales bacterium]|nr:hypothetical protein [Clostridiales bacterium]
MNAFIRQLAVLSIVWSLCEMLLPDGRQQKMARMTVSILVMAALVTAIGTMLGQDVTSFAQVPAFSEQTTPTEQLPYSHTALRSVANQAENLCVRMANSAGYQASAGVYLREDGALDHIELCILQRLGDDVPPLISEDDLIARIAGAFEADASMVQLTTQTDGAVVP